MISLSFSSSEAECKGKTGTCPIPVLSFDFDWWTQYVEGGFKSKIMLIKNERVPHHIGPRPP